MFTHCNTKGRWHVFRCNCVVNYCPVIYNNIDIIYLCLECYMCYCGYNKFISCWYFLARQNCHSHGYSLI